LEFYIKEEYKWHGKKVEREGKRKDKGKIFENLGE